MWIVRGTPFYMGPDRYPMGGHGKQFADQSTDVYSLGVCLWILTAKMSPPEDTGKWVQVDVLEKGVVCLTLSLSLSVSLSLSLSLRELF
jgi:hypothetical protein